MELVRARLRAHADGGARRAAVLRGVRARHDLELLDGVDGGARDLRGQLLDVLRDGVVVDAVEEEVVLDRAHAVHVDAAGAAEGGAAALLREAVALHPGHEREQVVPVADGQRELGHLALVHDGAQGGALGVQQPLGLDHGHRLRRPHAEREVHAALLRDVEDHGLARLLEPRRLRLHGVAPGHQAQHEVGPFTIGLRGGGGLRAGDGDGRVRNDRARRVLDRARQVGAIDLGFGQPRRQR